MKKINLVIGIALLLILNCYALLAVNSNSSSAQWTVANNLFKHSPHWRGSDDAYSIPLGNNRVLWLFGDTLVSNSDKFIPRSPDHIKMPRNSVGIMTGLNPAKASIKYYWGNNNSISKPESFFKSNLTGKDNWLWPGDGVLLPDHKTLIIFFMDIKPADNDWEFDIAGWQTAKITNIKQTPDKWKIDWLRTAKYKPFEILLGSGGVIVDQNYLYAFGGNNAKIGNNMYLARWPLHVFMYKRPFLSNPQWWTDRGWVENNLMKSRNLKPKKLWNEGQNEFTVTKLTDGKYVMFQTAYNTKNKQPGNSNLVYRTAKALTGPWSKQHILYKNLFRQKEIPADLNIYAGKYHPDLTDDQGDMIFTFASNTRSLKTLWQWQNVYYPSFLKIKKELFESQLNVKKTVATKVIE
ncbi:MAG TPA: DUF4185 domain-containing protein [Victivallales bacterium]|nr:DUF4185 domain-containing protein [Victivallales bacterium]